MLTGIDTRLVSVRLAQTSSNDTRQPVRGAQVVCPGVRRVGALHCGRREDVAVLVPEECVDSRGFQYCRGGLREERLCVELLYCVVIRVKMLLLWYYGARSWLLM